METITSTCIVCGESFTTRIAEQKRCPVCIDIARGGPICVHRETTLRLPVRLMWQPAWTPVAASRGGVSFRDDYRRYGMSGRGKLHMFAPRAVAAGEYVQFEVRTSYHIVPVERTSILRMTLKRFDASVDKTRKRALVEKARAMLRCMTEPREPYFIIDEVTESDSVKQYIDLERRIAVVLTSLAEEIEGTRWFFVRKFDQAPHRAAQWSTVIRGDARCVVYEVAPESAL